MINAIDYIFGLAHRHLNDQLNMVYTVKFSDSPRLGDLFDNVKKKIPALNSFYKELYSPFLHFEKSSSWKRQGDVRLLNMSLYKNLDLENYEFIRLDRLKSDRETEFVFTFSHIIGDAISLIALAYYLLNNYTLDKIISYINHPIIENNFSKYLKQTSFRESKVPKIFNYLKPIKRRSIISLKKREEGSISIPDIVRSTFSMSVSKEKSKKYKISRENYFLLKLVETIFKYCSDSDTGNECLICLSKNLRLNAINLVDEALGNYSFRRIVKFARQGNISFNEFVEQYSEILEDKSFFPKLIQEWLSIQRAIRLPRILLNMLVKSKVFSPSKFAATFTYLPMRAPILFPDQFLKTYKTTLIDYTLFLRVVKKHVPSFLLHPDPSGNYSLSLTFNYTFMDKPEAVKLFELYKNSLMEV